MEERPVNSNEGMLAKDPRTPSIKLAHTLDDVFELVNRGASSADVIPGHDEYPDLYPVMGPIELGDALVNAGKRILNMTERSTRNN